MPQSMEGADPRAVVAVGLALCAAIVMLLRRKVRPVVESVTRAMIDRLGPHLPSALRQRARHLADRLDSDTVRSTLVTAVAAGIAWAAAGTLGLTAPVTAVISAVLSVQLSSHASLREGAQRLIGLLAGIALTVVVWRLFGLSLMSIAVIAGCGLATGRLLRLGDGAVAVPATSLGILVVGGTVTESFVGQRVEATALGIVVGVILSPLVGGMTLRERARHELEHLSREIAGLLAALGAGARDGYDTEQAEQWLARSRELGEDLDEAVVAVRDLVQQARWSLTTPVSQVAPLRETLHALEHGVHQVNSVARSMFDAAAAPDAAAVPEQIGQVLGVASEAFAAHAALVADPGADPATDAGHLDDLVERLRETRQRTMRTVRSEVDDTGVLVLTGSIITDVDRMAGSLERSAPALAVGVAKVPEPEPVIPAVSEVLPVVREIWERRRVKTRLRAEHRRRPHLTSPSRTPRR
ncbi:aromatic acid exporter family protein [Actinoplanes sp. NPDC020271]|uniref:aromatic acid exporter family protein n=1 Tax=Actinoplanes sp. NPDC020271 TaxID=3363896 RepID=UPI0037A9C1F2